MGLAKAVIGIEGLFPRRRVATKAQVDSGTVVVGLTKRTAVRLGLQADLRDCADIQIIPVAQAK